MNQEPTNRELQRNIQDVMDAVNVFATGTQKQFLGIEKRLDKMDERFDGIDERLDGLDQRFHILEGRTGRIETGMVTKTYFDLRLGMLVDILADHRVITPSEGKRVLS